MAALFVAPIAALVLAMRSRWFEDRTRIAHPTEWPLWWRDTMDRLPPPFGDRPPGPRDRAKRRRQR